MVYNLRTGDILLCKNKPLNQTNAYLIVYDIDNGFGLWCITCGEALGFYGKDTNKMKEDILNKDFLNIQFVIQKETICDFINENYKLKYPINSYDGFNDLGIEIDI